MADEAMIQGGAIRFAEAIDAYARSRGWAREDYHLFMAFNGDLATLSILVVARAFDGRSEAQEYEDYDSIIDHLEACSLPVGHPFNSYSLVTVGLQGHAHRPPPSWDPPRFEIDERLLNDGISWREGSSSPSL